MGQRDIVKLLLDNGALPNAVDKDLWSPLHHAAREGHWSVVADLVAAGADVNIRDEVSAGAGSSVHVLPSCTCKRVRAYDRFPMPAIGGEGASKRLLAVTYHVVTQQVRHAVCDSLDVERSSVTRRQLRMLFHRCCKSAVLTSRHYFALQLYEACHASQPAHSKFCLLPSCLLLSPHFASFIVSSSLARCPRL